MDFEDVALDPVGLFTLYRFGVFSFDGFVLSFFPKECTCTLLRTVELTCCVPEVCFKYSPSVSGACMVEFAWGLGLASRREMPVHVNSTGHSRSCWVLGKFPLDIPVTGVHESNIYLGPSQQGFVFDLSGSQHNQRIHLY